MEMLIEEGTVVRIKPNNAWRVRRSTELEQALKELGCGVSFESVNGKARLN
jgi:hypothetical protein